MISLLLILLSFGGLAPKEPLENQDLRLTVRIVGILGYCATEPDYHQLHLRLELIFTNSGSRVLILQKRDLADVESWKMAETEQELGSAESAHLLWVISDSGDATRSATHSGSSPYEGFAVLKPGRSHKVRTELRPSSKRPLPGKESFLEVSVSTWSGTRQQAEKLQKRWEKTGLIWFKNVRSAPFSFVLDKTPKVKKCS